MILEKLTSPHLTQKGEKEGVLGRARGACCPLRRHHYLRKLIGLAQCWIKLVPKP